MSNQTPTRQAISLAGLHPTIAAAIAGPLAAMASPPELQTFRPSCGPLWARIFRSQGDVAAYERGYQEADFWKPCPHPEPGTPYYQGWLDGYEDASRAHRGGHDRACGDDGTADDAFEEA